MNETKLDERKEHDEINGFDRMPFFGIPKEALTVREFHRLYATLQVSKERIYEHFEFGSNEPQEILEYLNAIAYDDYGSEEYEFYDADANYFEYEITCTPNGYLKVYATYRGFTTYNYISQRMDKESMGMLVELINEFRKQEIADLGDFIKEAEYTNQYLK